MKVFMKMVSAVRKRGIVLACASLVMISLPVFAKETAGGSSDYRDMLLAFDYGDVSAVYRLERRYFVCVP